ncbi:MAG: hypothetical protein ABSA54_03820 [Terriglobales bacterium]
MKHATQADLDAAVERLNRLAAQMEIIISRRMRLINDAKLPEPESYQTQVDRRRDQMLGGDK